MKLPFAYWRASTVVIVAVSYAVIDTIGGGPALVVTVDNSAACTGIEAGGVPFTSFTIVDGTHVSGIPGAHASGTVDLVVTGTFGSSLPYSVEYWDPTVPNTPTLFLEAPDYVGGGSPLWTARVGSNYGSAVAPDENPTGTPDFIGANLDNLIADAFADTWSTLIGLTSTDGATIAAIVDLTSLPGVANNLMSDTQFLGAMYFEGSTESVSFAYQDGVSYKTCITSLGASTGRFVIVVQRDITVPASPVMRSTKDGASWNSSGVLAGPLSATQYLFMGDNAAIVQDYKLNAKVLSFVTTKMQWSDAEVTKYYAWANGRHP